MATQKAKKTTTAAKKAPAKKKPTAPKLAKSEPKKVHAKAEPIKVKVASDNIRPKLNNKFLLGAAVAVLAGAWIILDEPTVNNNPAEKSVVSRTETARKPAIIEVIDNGTQATPAIEEPGATRINVPKNRGGAFINTAIADLTAHLDSVDQRSANVAGTINNLQAQIQQLKGDISKLKSGVQEASSKENKNLVNTFLGQMMVFLTSNYQSGTANHQQIANIREFAEVGLQDQSLVTALDNLTKVTPENGIVTLSELNLMASKHQRMGPPKAEDLSAKNETAEPEEELSLTDKIKNKFSDWVSVSKTNPSDIPDFTHPWMMAIDEMQYKISRGDVAGARLLLTESEVLNRDKRLQELGNSMVVYLNQQNNLQRVFDIFVNSYVIQAK